MAYCWAATSGRAVFRTWVEVAGAGRQQRPDLVPPAVEPGEEGRLRRAAPVPVPLLEVRGHPAHPGAEPLRDDRREPGRRERGDAHLPLGGGGAADEADLAVG